MKSMAKSKSKTKHELSRQEEMDCDPAYKLQENNILLQKASRTSTKEMIKILSTFSTEMQRWTKNWHKYYANEQSKITDCESVWHIFGTSVSSIDDYIHNINIIIRNLEHAQESVPKVPKHQTFKFKVNQARADVVNLEKQLKELDETKENLDKQIAGMKDTSSSNFWKCVKPQTRGKDPVQRQVSTEVSIKEVKKLLEKKRKLFCAKQVQLYDEWKKEEVQRCELLKTHSSTFLESFNVKSDDFNELLEKYNPEKDLNRWEQEIFHRNANQTCKSRSTESKVPAGENESKD